MSISLGPPYRLTCNGSGCHKSETLEAQSFNRALDELRAYGWATRKISKEWFHYCPSCAERAGFK